MWFVCDLYGWLPNELSSTMTYRCGWSCVLCPVKSPFCSFVRYDGVCVLSVDWGNWVGLPHWCCSVRLDTECVLCPFSMLFGGKGHWYGWFVLRSWHRYVPFVCMLDWILRALRAWWCGFAGLWRACYCSPSPLRVASSLILYCLGRRIRVWMLILLGLILAGWLEISSFSYT